MINVPSDPPAPTLPEGWPEPPPLPEIPSPEIPVQPAPFDPVPPREPDVVPPMPEVEPDPME
jgi:hypothetical protein